MAIHLLSKPSSHSVTDYFDDYVRNRGINIFSMTLSGGIFFHWMYLSDEFLAEESLSKWYIILAWVVFAFLLPSVVFPLLTLGNNDPDKPRHLPKSIVSIIVAIGLTAEAVLAFVDVISVVRESEDDLELEYYLNYWHVIMYFFSLISGPIVIFLYGRILLFHTLADADATNNNSKSYHVQKMVMLRKLDDEHKRIYADSFIDEKNQPNDANSSNEDPARSGILNFIWPRPKPWLSQSKASKSSKESNASDLARTVPIPARVYQVIFVGFMGVILCMNISLYIRENVLDALDELQDNIDDLYELKETVNNISSYNSTVLNGAASLVETAATTLSYVTTPQPDEDAPDLGVPGSDTSDTSDNSDTSDSSDSSSSGLKAQLNYINYINSLVDYAEEAEETLDYAIELLESMHSYGSAFADGIIVGMVLAGISGTWGLFILRRAYLTKYLDMKGCRDGSETYDDENYAVFWTTRFVGGVGAYFIVGPLVAVLSVASFVGLLGWETFDDFVEDYWIYFVLVPLAWLLEVFVVRNCINKRLGSYERLGDDNEERETQPRKVFKLRKGKVNLWLWWIIFNDLLLLPVSLLMALGRFALLQFVAILSFVRPDVSVLPKSMQHWDNGHLMFVSTVNVMINRELLFAPGAHPSAPQKPTQSVEIVDV